MARLPRWARRRGRRVLFLALRAAARTAGFRRARNLGKWLGRIEYRLAWRRRRRCEHDMALALGRAPGDAWVGAQLKRAHEVNGETLTQIVAMFDRRQEKPALESSCEVEGTGRLQSALEAGHGAILLGTHMGNQALLAVQLAEEGWPVSIVYRQALMMSAGFFHQGFALYGVEGILANEGFRAYGRMLSALKRGRILFVTIDQGVRRPKDGIVVRFLGKEMPMAAGPAHLASRSGAPVLPVAVLAADPAWRFRIEAPLPPPTGDRFADLERLARATERQILISPQFWSWHHRRWWKYPPGEPRASLE